MIESAADRAAFFNPAEFGTEAVATPPAGFPVPVSGVLSAAHDAAGEGPGLSIAVPVFTAPLAALPPGLAGGVLTIDGADWRVEDVQPDGSGLARLPLSRMEE